MRGDEPKAMTTETCESPTIIACRMALNAARDREDCNMVPLIKSVQRVPLADAGPTYVVEVDVQYDSDGYQALYGYRERDGDFSLYQD